MSCCFAFGSVEVPTVFDQSRYISKFDPVYTRVLLNGGAGLLCKANPNRVLLMLTNIGSPSMWYSFNGNLTNTDAAIAVTTLQTVELSWATHGLLTTLAWYGYSLGAANPVAVTELMFFARR